MIRSATVATAASAIMVVRAAMVKTTMKTLRDYLSLYSFNGDQSIDMKRARSASTLSQRRSEERKEKFGKDIERKHRPRLYRRPLSYRRSGRWAFRRH